MNAASARLQEFCRIVQGGRLRLSGNDFVEDGFPAYGAGGLNGYLPTHEFDEPAVILSAIGARCGKCFYAEGKWASLANTQLIFADPRRADPKFLWFQLNDEHRWHRSGTGQPFIKPADVKTHKVFLPPLPEQRRIAEILDKADALRAKRRAALALLDSLTQSIFLDTFGDMRKNGCYPQRFLSECAEVVSGIAKGRKLDGKKKVFVPYLRVANVQAGYLDLSEIKMIEALPSEVTELALKAGDVVLTEGGDHDKLGRGAMWEGQVDGCIHQNHVFRVRPDQAQLLPRFFHEFLQSPAARSYFLRCAKRTTNLASINMTQLRALPVTLPPIELQKKFVRHVGAVRKLKTPYLASLADFDSFFASLQHRAFRGEL